MKFIIDAGQLGCDKAVWTRVIITSRLAKNTQLTATFCCNILNQHFFTYIW